MNSPKAALGQALRRCVPGSVRSWIPVSFKARVRAALGIEPWPDLAIRHALFATPQYKALRDQACAFDGYRKPYKPVIERGHQVSFIVADWFARSGVKSVFHAGYSNGRYLFYFEKMGLGCGGTELPLHEAPTTEVPDGVFQPQVLHRLIRLDFFELTPGHIRRLWPESGILPLSVLFTEATFETLIPWREKGFSVSKYAGMDPRARSALLSDKLPRKLQELKDCFKNMIFIEPEPAEGGAGEVFEACARRLPEFRYSVWRFRPPFDRLFRLSPTQSTTQAVYAYIRETALLQPLSAYAEAL